MTRDIPGISFDAANPYHSPLQLAFRAAAFTVPCAFFWSAWHGHAWPQLFAYLLYQRQTDPPREACRAQTATAMHLARTRRFPYCLTPGQLGCGTVRAAVWESVTLTLSELVWDRRSLSV
jgi:hypothetical protein